MTAQLREIHNYTTADTDDDVIATNLCLLGDLSGTLVFAGTVVNDDLVFSTASLNARNQRVAHDSKSGIVTDDQGGSTETRNLIARTGKQIFFLYVSSASDAEGGFFNWHGIFHLYFGSYILIPKPKNVKEYPIRVHGFFAFLYCRIEKKIKIWYD